jgi:large subunit ribosomal protein L22
MVISMPKWGYSAAINTGEGARASGRDLRISPKAAREICNAIRHMRLEEARIFLQEVIDLKRAVPYRHHKKKVGHKRGLNKWFAGRYPVKAAKEILKVLNSLEANCENQDLDVERVKLVHTAAQRARILKRYIPRAFGRSSPRHEHLCHIELMGEEI